MRLIDDPFKKLVRCLIIMGCIGMGATVAMADNVTLNDECNPGTFTTTPTGNNDLGFHCSGFSVYQAYVLAFGSNEILDVLSTDGGDEVYYTSDSSVNSLIGTDYAGQGQGGYNLNDLGYVAFDVQTNDGTWEVDVQSSATPEPSSIYLLLGGLPALAFAVRKRYARLSPVRLG